MGNEDFCVPTAAELRHKPNPFRDPASALMCSQEEANLLSSYLKNEFGRTVIEVRVFPS